MMHTAARTALELVHELWTERPQTCCPYVKHGEYGCWCASPALPEDGDSDDRRVPCDTASLQLWCLTEVDYTRCLSCPAGDGG
jgi:hypothetical protein